MERRGGFMLQRILAGSRYLIVIAVIGSFLTSMVILIYAGLGVITLIYNVFTHFTFTEAKGKYLVIECIELIDLFLLGAILYIVALGLYELFINENLPTPKWLVVTNLDDLKGTLLGVIVVLLAVTFLANVVNWNGSTAIVALGVAIGLVLFALGYLISQSFKPRPSKED
jgi:uncharacterized membrane protein YqhA